MAKSHVVTIVCFANSRRNKASCVAGRLYSEKGFGKWIRPVSGRESHELSETERCYTGGQEPKLLDVMSLRVIRASPCNHQKENFLIQHRSKWNKVDRLTWREVQAAIDEPDECLWVNGFSSGSAKNDYVPRSLTIGLRRSLYLISPKRLRIVVDGKRLRAKFRLKGHDYDLAITDRTIESEFRRRGDGSYAIKEALLCVSLGEVFEKKGKAYKLVAGVIRPKASKRK